jgi:predicted CoA-binding protein
MSANPTPDQIRSLLREVKTIAVVGLSPRAERPSYRVSRAMQGFGYRIVPVRPAVTEVLGEKAYARLSDILSGGSGGCLPQRRRGPHC